jgi:hypothetical protein
MNNIKRQMDAYTGIFRRVKRNTIFTNVSQICIGENGEDYYACINWSTGKSFLATGYICETSLAVSFETFSLLANKSVIQTEGMKNDNKLYK